MAKSDPKIAGNGFVGWDRLPVEASEPALKEQEMAHFLATIALARKCDTSAFLGRNVCWQEKGGMPFLAFADEVTVTPGTPSWDVSQETAELAQRQLRFMLGLGQQAPDARDEPAQPQSSPEIFATLLKRCSHEIQNDGRVIYQLDKVNIFVDHGKQLLMEPAADRNDEAILVALLLAKEKFKTFELTGDADFQRRALEIMVRHELDVPLKNATQQALKDELVKARDAEKAAKKDDQGTAASTMAKPSSAAREKPSKSPNGVSDGGDTARQEPAVQTNPTKAPLSEATCCVDAHAWWHSQAAIINSIARSKKEKEEQLQALGPAPEKGKTWWFDSAGNPRPEPKNPQVSRKLRKAAGMEPTQTPCQILPVPTTRPDMRSTRFAR